MKILIADPIDSSWVPALEDLDVEIDQQPHLTAEALPASMRDAEVLIVRSSKVCAEVLDAATVLSLIICVDDGVETLDVIHASRKGIFVCNCSQAGTFSASLGPDCSGKKERLRRLVPFMFDSKTGNSTSRSKKANVAQADHEKKPTAGRSTCHDGELRDLGCTSPINLVCGAVGDVVVKIIATYREKGIPLNVVNLRDRCPATVSLVVQYHTRIGVIADVFNELNGDDINVEEMKNLQFRSGGTACCVLILDNIPSDQLLHRISRSDDIIHIRIGWNLIQAESQQYGAPRCV
jgi:hypothetical protein